MSSDSHPVHPATVHFPIAFLSLAYALDILYGLSTHPSSAKIVASIYDTAPFLGDMARSSYYLSLLGVITGIPAILSGGQQLMGMLKKQDMANKLQKSQNKSATVQKMHPKLKIAFLHAALNDVAIVGTGYHWWTRRAIAGNAPTETGVLVSAGLFFSLLFSAFLGGKLVYEHGVGVLRAGEASRVKSQ
ncbi:hypothetical protein E2P81_ATG11857 [Venturia nashicola]|uniref:DUF2231 domain-containing protein n=1 Tax=Venturia nashicola TaxID=86259 RepID=A0A4Z1NL96_9PEZI|nr:hypothetical protein E6O75_ATG11548 [Venturia nashicola]TLD24521.1 hypothetical protein E2P81_ATG11857 [Venturia nashicola]